MFIFAWNRFAYFKRSIESLAQSGFAHMDGVQLVIVDDGSTDKDLLEFYDTLEQGSLFKDLCIWRGEKNLGLGPGSFERVENVIRQLEFKEFIFADSDALYAKNWLPALSLVATKARADGYKIAFATGFDTRDHFHAPYEEHEWYAFKHSAGGLNMLIDGDFYRQFPFRGGRWDWEASANAAKNGYKIVCPRRSFIQHIGANGCFSQPGNYDIARNFIGEHQDALRVLGAVPIS